MGEYRPYSFHYGIDLSTGSVSGKPVYATANGSIIRIMYGRYGIGYGVFLQQDDGRIAKYGHLAAFSSKITGFAFPEGEEPLNKREEFNLLFPEGALRVESGEIVAYSGETGSGVPHLHFELIENGVSLEPIQMGVLPIEDNQSPLLTAITLIPYGRESRINGKKETIKLPLVARTERDSSGKQIELPEFYLQGKPGHFA